MVCVYCRQERTTFTKEHVVPVCFGGSSKYLKGLVCSECNQRFGREFEGPFLKGPGVEAFLRAAHGLKGRREFPVFGDRSYGNRVYHTVSDDFPPLVVWVSRKSVRAPLQVIVQMRSGRLRHLPLKGERWKGEVRELLDNFMEEIASDEDPVAVFLWVSAADITVSSYRKMRHEFYRWLGRQELQGELVCRDFSGTILTLDWETSARQRMFAKMCLNYLFWLYPHREVCLQEAFDPIRNFILTGKGDGSRIVRQWTEPDHPYVKLAGTLSHYDLSVGLFEFKGILYGIVYFPKVGPFVVLVGSSRLVPERPIREDLKGYEGSLKEFISVTSGQPLFSVFDPSISQVISDGFTGHPRFADIHRG